MNSHLVTVKVSVKRCTNQRMQLNGLAFNQHRLKCLDTQTMQGGRTVQHDRMLTNHLLQDIPDLGALAFNQTLGSLDGGRFAAQLQLGENEGLEQFQRHLLGKTTLVKLQGRAYHDHRTTRVIHSLTQQVLAEATLLTLDHVSQ